MQGCDKVPSSVLFVEANQASNSTLNPRDGYKGPGVGENKQLKKKKCHGNHEKKYGELLASKLGSLLSLDCDKAIALECLPNDIRKRYIKARRAGPSINAAKCKRGNDFEQELVLGLEQMGREKKIVFKNLTNKGTKTVINALLTLEENTPTILYQPGIEFDDKLIDEGGKAKSGVPKWLKELRDKGSLKLGKGIPDFIFVYKASCLSTQKEKQTGKNTKWPIKKLKLFIVDAKCSENEKTQHQIQVALYQVMLKILIEKYRINERRKENKRGILDISYNCGLWLPHKISESPGCKIKFGEDFLIQPLDMGIKVLDNSVVLEKVNKLLSDRILSITSQEKIDGLFWHLGSSCRRCTFVEYCRKESYQYEARQKNTGGHRKISYIGYTPKTFALAAGKCYNSSELNNKKSNISNYTLADIEDLYNFGKSREDHSSNSIPEKLINEIQDFLLLTKEHTTDSTIPLVDCPGWVVRKPNVRCHTFPSREDFRVTISLHIDPEALNSISTIRLFGWGIKVSASKSYSSLNFLPEQFQNNANSHTYLVPNGNESLINNEAENKFRTAQINLMESLYDIIQCCESDERINKNARISFFFSNKESYHNFEKIMISAVLNSIEDEVFRDKVIRLALLLSEGTSGMYLPIARQLTFVNEKGVCHMSKQLAITTKEKYCSFDQMKKKQEEEFIESYIPLDFRQHFEDILLRQQAFRTKTAKIQLNSSGRRKLIDIYLMQCNIDKDVLELPDVFKEETYLNELEDEYGKEKRIYESEQEYRKKQARQEYLELFLPRVGYIQETIIKMFKLPQAGFYELSDMFRFFLTNDHIPESYKGKGIRKLENETIHELWYASSDETKIVDVISLQLSCLDQLVVNLRKRARGRYDANSDKRYVDPFPFPSSKFCLPPVIELRDETLTKLAFIIQYESSKKVKELKSLRYSGENTFLGTGKVFALVAEGEKPQFPQQPLEKRLANLCESSEDSILCEGDCLTRMSKFRLDKESLNARLSPNFCMEWIIVPRTNEGIEIAQTFLDASHQGKYQQYNSPWNCAKICRVEDTGLITLETTALRFGLSRDADGNHVTSFVDERCKNLSFLLFPRYVDLGNDKKMLDEMRGIQLDLTQQPPEHPLFLELLKNPAKWGTGPPTKGCDIFQGTISELEHMSKHGKETLQKSQLAAFRNCCNNQLQCIWGPPGSGKTHFISYLVVSFAARFLSKKKESRETLYILVTGATNSAIATCLDKIAVASTNSGLSKEDSQIVAFGRNLEKYIANDSIHILDDERIGDSFVCSGNQEEDYQTLMKSVRPAGSKLEESSYEWIYEDLKDLLRSKENLTNVKQKEQKATFLLKLFEFIADNYKAINKALMNKVFALLKSAVSVFDCQDIILQLERLVGKNDPFELLKNLKNVSALKAYISKHVPVYFKEVIEKQLIEFSEYTNGKKGSPSLKKSGLIKLIEYFLMQQYVDEGALNIEEDFQIKKIRDNFDQKRSTQDVVGDVLQKLILAFEKEPEQSERISQLVKNLQSKYNKRKTITHTGSNGHLNEDMKGPKVIIVGSTPWKLCKIGKKAKKANNSEDTRSIQPFKLQVFDEGSQMTVAQSALPIHFLDPKSGRLVVVGDHLQLPPIIKGDYPEPKPGQPKLYGSILDCLLRDITGKPTESNPFGPLKPATLNSSHNLNSMLKENYRMNQALGECAKYLYGNEYESVNKTLTLQLKTCSKCQDSSNPTDKNHQNMEKLFDSKYSLVTCYLLVTENEQKFMSPEDAAALEAQHVSRIICHFLNHYDGNTDSKNPASQIIVVTPHHVQRHAINAELERNLPAGIFARDIFIGTAETAQGKTADMTILCYGFLSELQASQDSSFIFDLNRMNVATTRARCKSILLLGKAVEEGNVISLENMQLQYGYKLLMNFVASSKKVAISRKENEYRVITEQLPKQKKQRNLAVWLVGKREERTSSELRNHKKARMQTSVQPKTKTQTHITDIFDTKMR